jgi:hypothetical protein
VRDSQTDMTSMKSSLIRVLSDIVKRWFVLPVRGLHVSSLWLQGVRLLTGLLQGEPRSKLVLIFQDWWSFLRQSRCDCAGVSIDRESDQVS